MSNNDPVVMLVDAQIDNYWDSLGDAGMPEKAFRPMAFVEDRFANRSHVQGRKGVDVTSVGLTRVVDQASAHSLLPVLGRYLARNPTDSTQKNREILRIACTPRAETGSYLTAHTTTQSDANRRFPVSDE